MKKTYYFIIACFTIATACTTQDPIERKVENLLAQMTLEEKIGQMNQLDMGWDVEMKEDLLRRGGVGSVFNCVDKELINKYQHIAVEETRLGIPLVFARDVIHGYKTIYPIPLGQAATWNPALVEYAARLTAGEAVQDGIRWAFSPMVDVARDPRWGRVAEGYGEDTYLASVMGAAVVRGYKNQRNDGGGENDYIDSDNVDSPCQRSSILMAACVKHFAGYSASEGGRDYNTTWIPEVQLRDVYLPPFKAALDAGAASIMCSFNALNGLPSSANPHLNIDILRKEWKSDALLVSDWGSGSDLVPHGLAADKKEAALLCIDAQMEMDMQGLIYVDYLKELIREGKVKERQIDDCVRDILRLKYRLGLFDNPYVDEGKSEFYTQASLAAAQQAAEESAVLLKNNGILPLENKMNSKPMILVCGPLADQQKEQLGTWIFDGEPQHSVTPLMAFRELESKGEIKLLFEEGLTYSRDKNTAHFSKVVQKARQADAILFFAGEEAILSGEARCRADISLPGAQTDLLKELKKTGKPVVLIVMAGRPLTIGKEVELADAVLYSFHGGTMAGPALRNLIMGDVVPSGKLPITFPKMVGQIPLYYNRLNTGRPSYDPPMLIDSIPIGCPQFSIGQSSYWLETPTEPLFPFGYGLSYTTFRYSEPKIEIKNQKSNITARCTITNTGTVDAYEVAQLYTRQRSGSVARPLRELRDFRKIFIPAGESREVEFTLTKEQLGYWHEKHDCQKSEVWFETDEADFYLWIAPNSVSGQPVEFTTR